MRRALAIAWKDLRSIYRTPSALATLLAAPLGVALILGMAFGGQGSFQIQAVKTVVADLSATAPGTTHEEGAAAGDALASAALVDVLTGKQTAALVDTSRVATAAAARQAVDSGKAVAAVIIPRDFNEAVGAVGVSQTQVEVYVDPTQQVGPAVVEGLVQQVVAEIDGARAAAVAAAEASLVGGMATGDAQSLATVAQDAARRFAAGSGEQGVTIQARAPSSPDGEASTDPGITGIVLAGQLVLFTFFGASIAARTILVEQDEGTLARLFTTPAKRSWVLGGKFLSAFFTVVAQSLVILLVGWFGFRISWGAALPVLVLVLVGCVVACGLAMLIGAASRTLGQEGAIGSGIFLILALMGGNFTGSFASGGTAQFVSRLVPNGWLLMAWDTTMRGGSVADITLHLLVALGFSVVFFAVAVAVLRRRFA